MTDSQRSKNVNKTRLLKGALSNDTTTLLSPTSNKETHPLVAPSTQRDPLVVVLSNQDVVVAVVALVVEIATNPKEKPFNKRMESQS